MTSTRISLALVTVLAIVVPRAALAQNASADALIAHGLELRQRQDDAGALAEFRRAYDLEHTPRVMAQIALAEQALGRWVDADAHMREAVASSTDPWIVRNQAVLRGAQDSIGRHVGSLQVLGGVDGATVYIDGVRIATLPMAEPRRIEVGEVQLEVRAPGYATAHRTLEIAAGSSTRETVTLAPVEGTTSGLATPPASVAPSTSSPAATATETPHATHIGIVPIALIAAGAVVAIVGGGLIAARDGAVGNCVVGASAIECPTMMDQQRASAAPAYHDAAIAAFAVGGVAVAAGIAWIVARITAHPADAQARVHFDAAPRADGGWIGASVRF